MEPGGVGRVGFASADGMMILPVNFAVTAATIIFRTAPDTLLALHADSQVSFEVDRIDEALHGGWSVLVQGHAHTVTDEREVQHLEGGTHLEPWAGGARGAEEMPVAARSDPQATPSTLHLSCKRRPGANCGADLDAC